jgi:hypothetical protein
LVARLAVVVALGGIVVLTSAAVAQTQPVHQAAPVATTTVDFSYTPAAPTANEAVTFTSTSSLARPIVRESWDFDGDGHFDASGHAVTHTFVSAGVYSVTLEAQNDRGRIRSASKLVSVLGAASPPSSPTPPPAAPAPPPAPPAPAPQPAAPATPTPTTGSATGAPPATTTIAPFPIVRIAGVYSSSGVRLRVFAVTAPSGVRITVRCGGRGCPYRKRGPFVVRATTTGHPGGVAQRVPIGGFRGRLLKPGVRLEVFVAHPAQIGKYTRFTIRRGHSPLRTVSCLRPSGTVFSCR